MSKFFVHNQSVVLGIGIGEEKKEREKKTEKEGEKEKERQKGRERRKCCHLVTGIKEPDFHVRNQNGRICRRKNIGKKYKKKE